MSDPIKPTEFIPTAINMIQAQLGIIDASRARNTQTATWAVGAIIAFSVSKQTLPTVIFMATTGTVVTLALWHQDYLLHRFWHGWFGMGERIRQFLSGELEEKDLRLLEYLDEDANQAKIFSRTTSAIFLVLLVGSLALIPYRLFVGVP